MVLSSSEVWKWRRYPVRGEPSEAEIGACRKYHVQTYLVAHV